MEMNLGVEAAQGHCLYLGTLHDDDVDDKNLFLALNVIKRLCRTGG